MDEFAIGDTVQAVGDVMTGNVGTVISKDEKRGKILVLVSNVTQNYFAPEELKKFEA